MTSIPDVDSLAHFTQNASELVERIKESGTPLVLTIDGKAEVVVQDAVSYRRLLEIAERLETVEALKEGLRDVDEGRTRPAAEVFEDFRQRYGISD